MKPWHRALVVLVSMAGLFVTWRVHSSGLATLILAVCFAWLGRAAYRSGLAKNPLGNDADYSIGPAIRYGLTAIALFVIAIIWVMTLANVVPDTNFGAAMLLGPALLILLAGSIYVWRALSRFQQGGRK
jgi:uncharacterized membrane protein (DUF485 family)